MNNKLLIALSLIVGQSMAMEITVEEQPKTEEKVFYVTPDGKKIVSGPDDCTVRLLDMNGQELGVFSGHDDTVQLAVVTKDGKLIITASSDGTTLIWNMKGELLEMVY